MRQPSVYVVLVIAAAHFAIPRFAIAADAPVDYQQKATAAYALGHYAEAADAFEKAFAASPEPALLYNAAQAYRRAGNNERALTLYENYLQVFGGQGKRAEIEAHIAELKKAIEHDRAASTKPPNGIEPVTPVEPTATAKDLPLAHPPPPPPAIVAAAPEPQNQPVVAAAPQSEPLQAPSPDQDRPLTSKGWFWGVIGGVVVAAIVVGVVVASSGSKDPTASLGGVKGP
jgi:tetratricopeptide (TPR) repeat protein